MSPSCLHSKLDQILVRFSSQSSIFSRNLTIYLRLRGSPASFRYFLVPSDHKQGLDGVAFYLPSSSSFWWHMWWILGADDDLIWLEKIFRHRHKMTHPGWLASCLSGTESHLIDHFSLPSVYYTRIYSTRGVVPPVTETGYLHPVTKVRKGQKGNWSLMVFSYILLWGGVNDTFLGCRLPLPTSWKTTPVLFIPHVFLLFSPVKGGIMTVSKPVTFGTD